MTRPPVWPQELSDETPLPYRTWKVLDLIDGHLSAAEVARLAGVSEDEVAQALAEAAGRAESHQRLMRPVDASLQQEITRVLGSLIGPIAGVLVEEAVEELGPAPRAGTVFQRISQELEPQQRSAFAHLARDQGLA
ncbi:hypothetical protein GCM10017783_20150 [Deinococcus piscis]|uniref:DUF8082 domain-containing protein n=1 Tax=Deinococcus piscis TaxID=394230 RepID=A0ABQ3K994_9DEIO|nr:hypothetical protein [Deinococcus piscis]GHG07593.1 hypothetical protein GCM10017783_20150 [Deinococcus piscis]